MVSLSPVKLGRTCPTDFRGRRRRVEEVRSALSGPPCGRLFLRVSSGILRRVRVMFKPGVDRTRGVLTVTLVGRCYPRTMCARDILGVEWGML